MFALRILIKFVDDLASNIVPIRVNFQTLKFQIFYAKNETKIKNIPSADF